MTSPSLGSSSDKPKVATIIKRSIAIAGHKTSISLEDAFWQSLRAIADARDIKLSDLVASIDSERKHPNLSSAIRLFVLDHYQRLSAGDKELK